MRRNSPSHDLDTFDRKILNELQRDNRQSLTVLGDRVGLSEPSVRRRIKALRTSGVIMRDVSLVDPGTLALTVIVSVRLDKESRGTYDRLKALIDDTPEIVQAYTVTGDEDFILIGHFQSMTDYDDWINEAILTEPSIARTTTNVVYRRVKYETAVSV